MILFEYIFEFIKNQEGNLRILDHMNVYHALKYTWAC